MIFKALYPSFAIANEKIANGANPACAHEFEYTDL
jgi:hypothetical protein